MADLSNITPALFWIRLIKPLLYILKMTTFIIPAKAEALLHYEAGQYCVEEIFSVRLIPIKLQGRLRLRPMAKGHWYTGIVTTAEIYELALLKGH